MKLPSAQQPRDLPELLRDLTANIEQKVLIGVGLAITATEKRLLTIEQQHGTARLPLRTAFNLFGKELEHVLQTQFAKPSPLPTAEPKKDPS
jgi:hypothetical protein